MKVAIIGGGSIGQRHCENLKKLGAFTRIIDIDEIHKIDEILQEGFDAGFVCSPTSEHINHCLKLAEFNLAIFCEKPFYNQFNDKTKHLLEVVKNKNLTTMVGCNLRFLPEIQRINPETKYINVRFGYDLKKWRPNADHLKSYSSNKNLGGGILLDAIHEIDYLYYKFGEIKTLEIKKNKISSITNDTEDLAKGRVYFSNGTIADFSLDYLSKEYQRYYEILDEDELIKVELFISNQMYLDEIKYFVDCVANKMKCMNDFFEASYLLEKLIK